MRLHVCDPTTMCGPGANSGGCCGDPGRQHMYSWTAAAGGSRILVVVRRESASSVHSLHGREATRGGPKLDRQPYEYGVYRRNSSARDTAVCNDDAADRRTPPSGVM